MCEHDRANKMYSNTVAAPGGVLGFLETGQTLPAINFYCRA